MTKLAKIDWRKLFTLVYIFFTFGFFVIHSYMSHVKFNDLLSMGHLAVKFLSALLAPLLGPLSWFVAGYLSVNLAKTKSSNPVAPTFDAIAYAGPPVAAVAPSRRSRRRTKHLERKFRSRRPKKSSNLMAYSSISSTNFTFSSSESAVTSSSVSCS